MTCQPGPIDLVRLHLLTKKFGGIGCNPLTHFTQLPLQMRYKTGLVLSGPTKLRHTLGFRPSIEVEVVETERNDPEVAPGTDHPLTVLPASAPSRLRAWRGP